jgi:hypothetical protein
VADPEFDRLLMERGLIPSPADKALETLALIEEHGLTLEPEDGGWLAYKSSDLDGGAMGRTIGDAVRAVVARIKSAP